MERTPGTAWNGVLHLQQHGDVGKMVQRNTNINKRACLSVLLQFFPQLLKGRKESLSVKPIVCCLLMWVVVVDKMGILSLSMKVGGQRRGMMNAWRGNPGYHNAHVIIGCVYTADWVLSC